jgi:hypothetical protein
MADELTDLLEPSTPALTATGGRFTDSFRVELSLAISLKRIADVLERVVDERHNEPAIRTRAG